MSCSRASRSVSRRRRRSAALSAACTSRRLLEPVTYAKDVARIFNKHCVECHHPGRNRPVLAHLLRRSDRLGRHDRRGRARRGACRPGTPIPNMAISPTTSVSAPRKSRRSPTGSKPARPKAIPRICPTAKVRRGLAHSQARRGLHRSQAVQSEGDWDDRVSVFRHRHRLHGGQMGPGCRGETELSSRRPSRARLRSAAERALGSNPAHWPAGRSRRSARRRPEDGACRRPPLPVAPAGKAPGRRRSATRRTARCDRDGGFISKWLTATVPGASPTLSPQGWPSASPPARGW